MVMQPHTSKLSDTLVISRLMGGLWQIADMERDHKSLDLEKEIGHLIDLDRIDGYFSIAEYLEKRPDIEVKWINGLPWADEIAWNNAKADYCYEHSIDILFDDSPIYVDTFNDIPTVYAQIHNPNRKRFKTRPNTK